MHSRAFDVNRLLLAHPHIETTRAAICVPLSDSKGIQRIAAFIEQNLRLDL